VHRGRLAAKSLRWQPTRCRTQHRWVVTASSTPGRAASTLTATAPSPYSAQLLWSPVPAAATVEVYMNGGLVDRFPASANDTYTVRELWSRSSYTFAVNLLSG